MNTLAGRSLRQVTVLSLKNHRNQGSTRRVLRSPDRQLDQRRGNLANSQGRLPR